MPRSWPVKISGSGIVSYQGENRRHAVPHGEYTMIELSDGNYELRGSGQIYVIDGTDVPQYVENRTLKILEGDWP